MSESKLPPEPWRPLYRRLGVEFGYRPLATRIGMEHSTLARVLKGERSSKASIQKVADAFGISVEQVHKLRGESAAHAYSPFVLPDEAGRLNDKERRAIRAVIRALLDAKEPLPQSSDNSESWGGDAGPGGGLDPHGDWPQDSDERHDIV